MKTTLSSVRAVQAIGLLREIGVQISKMVMADQQGEALRLTKKFVVTAENLERIFAREEN